MAEKMYFGVPGNIQEIPYPVTGMGFDTNGDTEVTNLISGGRSVYRAPTTFKTFNQTWRTSADRLRHLIDCYNGQFGPGPFYLTDPTVSQENVLPPRWSNAWQLAHQAGGWCRPSVTTETAPLTALNTVYRTDRKVTFTQAAVGASVLLEGVVRTRLIRIPGKNYYLAATGAATGGAAIKVRAFNSATNAWVLHDTFTTFTGASTLILSSGNTTYTMLELDLYMPLGSTLTLRGIVFGTVDATAIQSILSTNYSRNPWATSATGFATYSLGTGETANTTYITGATDGPVVAGLTTYARATVTVAKTSGSSGFLGTVSANRGLLPGVAGESATVGLWLRYNGAGTLGGRLRASTYDVGGAVVTTFDAPTVTLVSGEWARVTSTVVSGATFASVGWWFYSSSGQVIPVGGSLDATGVTIVAGSADPGAFSGSSPDNDSQDRYYRWTGTAHASTSVMLNQIPTDWMPVGQGVGAVQFTNTAGGELVSSTIDRVGLSLDFTEVQNVESLML